MLFSWLKCVGKANKTAGSRQNQCFIASSSWLVRSFPRPTLRCSHFFSSVGNCEHMRQAETWGMGTPGAIPSTVHHSSRSWSELFMLEGGGVFLTWNKLQNTLGKSECVRAPKTLPDAPQAAEALGAGPAAVAYPDSLVSER